jgi:paired small multidrug resistance pump
MLNLQWYDFVGFVGVLLVLAAYFLLQTSRMRGDGMAYSIINMVGAAGILIPVIYAREMNWSVLFIEAAWIAISVYGLWNAMKRGLRKAPPGTP